jgi:nicotinate-nucleotide pyrophosphorylase (carboxylating)
MIDPLMLKNFIASALAEDIGDGDHSTLSVIDSIAKGKAVLKIKQEGLLAGVDIAKEIFHFKQKDAHISIIKKDGETMKPGDVAFEVEAHATTILSCERLVLNCMQRMSGIATLTHEYVEKIKGSKAKILDTRKTTPNFRLLEKEAVRIGGAVNHRFGLYDMMMLKDNHIDYAGGIEAAIEKAWKYVQEKKPGLKIEVETRSMQDVEKILAIGKGKIFRVMLDNFKPGEVKRAVEKIDGVFETEASGGINMSNVEVYAKTGVDYISIGALIHQAKSLDMSLKAVI